MIYLLGVDRNSAMLHSLLTTNDVSNSTYRQFPRILNICDTIGDLALQIWRSTIAFSRFVSGLYFLRFHVREDTLTRKSIWILILRIYRVRRNIFRFRNFVSIVISGLRILMRVPIFINSIKEMNRGQTFISCSECWARYTVLSIFAIK